MQCAALISRRPVASVCGLGRPHRYRSRDCRVAKKKLKKCREQITSKNNKLANENFIQLAHRPMSSRKNATVCKFLSND